MKTYKQRQMRQMMTEKYHRKRWKQFMWSKRRKLCWIERQIMRIVDAQERNVNSVVEQTLQETPK